MACEYELSRIELLLLKILVGAVRLRGFGSISAFKQNHFKVYNFEFFGQSAILVDSALASVGSGMSYDVWFPAAFSMAYRTTSGATPLSVCCIFAGGILDVGDVTSGERRQGRFAT